jgi:hypothetical protein
VRLGWIVALLIAAIAAGLIAVAIGMNDWENRCVAAGGVVEPRFVGIIGKAPTYTYHCMLDGTEIQP